MARSTVARLTGLSPASVTEHCARLAGLGLIRESPAPRRSGRVGRPHVPLELDDARFVVGGVHVAVPYTTVALLDLRGRVPARRELKHERTDPAGVLARAAEGLCTLFAEAPGRPPLGVGVAVGGWADRAAGTVVEHELLGWREVLTMRQRIGRRGHQTFAGTPEQVADRIETWFTRGAADGFTIMPPVLPPGPDAFVDHVVPILRARGLFRTEYGPRRTLRRHYGLPRRLHRVTVAGDVPAGVEGKESYAIEGDASHYTPVPAPADTPAAPRHRPVLDPAVA